MLSQRLFLSGFVLVPVLLLVSRKFYFSTYYYLLLFFSRIIFHLNVSCGILKNILGYLTSNICYLRHSDISQIFYIARPAIALFVTDADTVRVSIMSGAPA